MRNFRFGGNLFLLFFLLPLCWADESPIQTCGSLFVASEEQPIVVESSEHPFDLAREMRALGKIDEANKVLRQVEKRLKKEEIVNVSYLGGGVNHSYLLTFESGIRAVYKPVLVERPNQPIRERATYLISKLFNLDIVPPTLIRKLKGQHIPEVIRGAAGSVQLFIDTAQTLEKKKSNGVKVLAYKDRLFQPEDEISGRRLRVFDWLINNHDRGTNAGNYMVSDIDGYIFGIDHGVSFVGMDKTAREGKVPFFLPEFLDDFELYEKLKNPSRNEIIRALDGLKPVRIEEFLQRYDQLMKAFEHRLGL